MLPASFHHYSVLDGVLIGSEDPRMLAFWAPYAELIRAY
jgi:hypothetical protein